MKKLLLLAGLLSVFSLGMAASEASNEFKVKATVVPNLKVTINKDIDFGEVPQVAEVVLNKADEAAVEIQGIYGEVSIKLLDNGAEVEKGSNIALGKNIYYSPTLKRVNGGQDLIGNNGVTINGGDSFKLGGTLITEEAPVGDYSKTLTLKVTVER